MSISIKNRVRKLAEKHWKYRDINKIKCCTKKEFIKIFNLGFDIANGENSLKTKKYDKL